MGKGSRPRPFEVDHKEFSDSWDKIFGKKEEKKSERKDPETHQTKKTK